jgi:ribosomal protein L19
MDVQLIKSIQGDAQKEVPTIETGMEVEVYQILKEGDKERIQKFRGLVLLVLSQFVLTSMELELKRFSQ